ncbi:DUF6881 domain-containing protein [Chengkuizengella sp. SCS-71B]|uniref:DUF6881 domain-containing protein n=1 Tax=Chengkuizengella sp. SCS-71B TaxID=3115290 RepID=UPI0032C20E21
MKYLYVEWMHKFLDEPIVLISELDENRFEQRKIEIYKDGKAGYAINKTEIHDTRLSVDSIPEIHNIALNKKFKPKYISKNDFTRIWNAKENYKVVEIDVSNIMIEKK